VAPAHAVVSSSKSGARSTGGAGALAGAALPADVGGAGTRITAARRRILSSPPATPVTRTASPSPGPK
jgi:hypothetical protein